MFPRLFFIFSFFSAWPQICTDLMLSPDPSAVELAAEGAPGSSAPLYFSNPDLLWKAEHPFGRLGQGAFRLSLEACLAARLQALGVPPGSPRHAAFFERIHQFGKPEVRRSGEEFRARFFCRAWPQHEQVSILLKGVWLQVPKPFSSARSLFTHRCSPSLFTAAFPRLFTAAFPRLFSLRCFPSPFLPPLISLAFSLVLARCCLLARSPTRLRSRPGGAVPLRA